MLGGGWCSIPFDQHDTSAADYCGNNTTQLLPSPKKIPWMMIVTDEMENHPPHPKKRENKKRPVFIVPPWMFVEVPIEVEEKHVALQWST